MSIIRALRQSKQTFVSGFLNSIHPYNPSGLSNKAVMEKHQNNSEYDLE